MDFADRLKELRKHCFTLNNWTHVKYYGNTTD